MLYGDGLEPYGFSFFTAVKIRTTKDKNTYYREVLLIKIIQYGRFTKKER